MVSFDVSNCRSVVLARPLVIPGLTRNPDSTALQITTGCRIGVRHDKRAKRRMTTTTTFTITLEVD